MVREISDKPAQIRHLLVLGSVICGGDIWFSGCVKSSTGGLLGPLLSGTGAETVCSLSVPGVCRSSTSVF